MFTAESESQTQLLQAKAHFLGTQRCRWALMWSALCAAPGSGTRLDGGLVVCSMFARVIHPGVELLRTLVSEIRLRLCSFVCARVFMHVLFKFGV